MGFTQGCRVLGWARFSVWFDSEVLKTAPKKIAASGIELCEAWWYRIGFLKKQVNVVCCVGLF
jgi:hypothetical protein